MFIPVAICRHRDIEWFDATRCRCRSCNRVGQWLDGFMLWARKNTRHDFHEKDESTAGVVMDSEGPMTSTSVANVA